MIISAMKYNCFFSFPSTKLNFLCVHKLQCYLVGAAAEVDVGEVALEGTTST